MNYTISESGDFRTFTNTQSGESYRVPVRDILLVLQKQGPPPDPNDIVELNSQQEAILRDLDAKWKDLGDEAARTHNKRQGCYGCISWLVVLGIVGFAVWWFFIR